MVTTWIPHTASLDIPELRKSASIAHVFPGMTNHYLLSVGQLCNEGYYTTFRIDAVTIYSSAGKSQPHLRTRIYAHTYQSTQRATQLTGVLAHAYYVSIQNLNTVSTKTVP
jgi:hypothetical protein